MKFNTLYCAKIFKWCILGQAPSVIQLRVENILPSLVGKIVLETLQSGEKQLESGALITIDPRRQRIRVLPLTK